MMQQRWWLSGALVVMWLLAAGCAKQVPLAPSSEQGDRAAVSPPGTSEPPPAEAPGRLDERDRSAIEGRMSGGGAEPDPEAARAAFLSEDVLFAYNSFALSEEAKQLLEQKAQWMAQHPGVTVQLEGHCDERGTVAYNLALGERRANAVRQYMTALGVRAGRMTTISYGEEFPLDPGHHEAAWARNRRAHFAVLNP